MIPEYVCKKCGSIALSVTVICSAELTQEGGNVQTSVDSSDHEWDGNSTMWCRECSHAGTAAEFLSEE